MRRMYTGWIVLVLLAVVLAACGGETTGEQTDAPDGELPATAERPLIRVGSKDFPEQFILGEMYALILEDAGFTVERRLNLGATPVAQSALTAGAIDLYPEYTGTGLLTVLGLPVSTDPQDVFDQVSAGYAEQFNLVWLEPAPMNNTQALAMRREQAEELGISTISDMVAHASELIMIGPDEFQEREDGLPGLRKIYGDFNLRAYRAVGTGALRYQGLVNGDADVVVAFGTDGEISAFDLVVLEDDQNMFPPYQVAPVVRRDTLEAHPQIADALNALAPRLTDGVMQELNYEVTGNQREPADVARDFLIREGFLQTTP